VENTITKVALDTHKKQHTVAWVNCETGQTEVTTVKNNSKDIKKMVKKLKKASSSELHFCYEAGVCGFTLQRRLEALGCQCDVIAPSLIPIKPGDRIKTDRRDAKKLLGLFAAGELTMVHPPNAQQEAAREVTRCRHAAQENLKRIRHQLIKFLTRHGYIYKDGNHWTKTHTKWLSTLQFDENDLQQVFAIIYTELEHCVQRLASLDKEIQALAERPEYRKIVGLLRCFRGIDTLTAVILITEIFDFGRFESASALMCYLGLVPSEYSSGDKRSRGGITKAGNTRVRRALVESAWHYRHHPNVSRTLKQRRQDQPLWALDIADRAMLRLFKRYHHLINRGKVPQKVTVAIARELAGFIWAIMREHQVREVSNAA
jgi:transposase